MNLHHLPQFVLKSQGIVSKAFLEQDIYDFHSAAMYIARIPYGRNSSRDNYELVLTERVGTSSTKHALLRQLCK